MEALTPASADDLPPIAELIVDEPFWRHPAVGLAAEGVAHLRIWTTATDPPGHLAVVTETGLGNSVTESAGRIWADLVRRYSPSLVLLEYHPHPTSPKARRPWTWSALARMAARTGPASGRPRKQSPPRRAGAVDGRSRAADPQQACQ